jgi:anti-anti-sigma regulatory factor
VKGPPPRLRVAGVVDLSTRPAWESALAALSGMGRRPRLELSGLDFIDASGAAALVASAQNLDGPVLLHRPPRVLTRILEVLWPDLQSIEVDAG